MPQSHHSSTYQPGWRARLDLRFECVQGRTRMRRGKAYGPLYVQKPFYPEPVQAQASTCHAYVLHPPGGVVGGDRLTVNVDVEAAASALLTTPAATKFYRSAGDDAVIRQRFHVAGDASLEWLPQENVLYSGSRARSRTEVYLARHGRYLGWELNCFGLPASNRLFTEGVFDQRTAIYRTADGYEPAAGAKAATNATPLLLERNHWAAGEPVMSAQWGLADSNVAGSLYATPVGDDELSVLRSRLDAAPATADKTCGVTVVNGVLIARVLSDNAEIARGWLTAVWGYLRPLVLRRAPSPPRIWNT